MGKYQVLFSRKRLIHLVNQSLQKAQQIHLTLNATPQENTGAYTATLAGDTGKQQSLCLLIGILQGVMLIEILTSTLHSFISNSPLPPSLNPHAHCTVNPQDSIDFFSGTLISSQLQYFICAVQSKQYYPTENSLAL